MKPLEFLCPSLPQFSLQYNSFFLCPTEAGVLHLLSQAYFCSYFTYSPKANSSISLCSEPTYVCFQIYIYSSNHSHIPDIFNQLPRRTLRLGAQEAVPVQPVKSELFSASLGLGDLFCWCRISYPVPTATAIPTLY